MAKIQLNLKMPPELVARLRQEAAEAGITVTALAERRLAGGYPVATPQLPEQVSDRLAALEQRVLVLEADRMSFARLDSLFAAAMAEKNFNAALEQRVTALEADRSSRPTKPVEQLVLATPVAEAPHAGGDGAAPPPVGERLGTAQLAKLLGVRTSTLQNFACSHPDGSVRGDWRLVGRVASARGGPHRIVWERVDGSSAGSL